MSAAEFLVGGRWHRLSASAGRFVFRELSGCSGEPRGDPVAVPGGGVLQIALEWAPERWLRIPLRNPGGLRLNGLELQLTASGLEVPLSDDHHVELIVRFRATGDTLLFHPELWRSFDNGVKETSAPEGEEWKQKDSFHPLAAAAELRWILKSDNDFEDDARFFFNHPDSDLSGSRRLRVRTTPLVGSEDRSLAFLRQAEADDDKALTFHGSTARLYDPAWTHNPSRAFLLVQFPVRGEGACDVEWRWAVAGAYDRTGQQAWNAVANGYLAHHHVLLGGGGTSFLPRLPIDETAPPERGWAVLLRRDMVHAIAVPETFAPMAPGRLAIEFGGLSNHQGKGVSGTAAVVPPGEFEPHSAVFAEAVPDLDKLSPADERVLLEDLGQLAKLRTVSGRRPTLALDAALAVEPDPQRVRVGAFDLQLGRLPEAAAERQGPSKFRVAADSGATAFDADVEVFLPVAYVVAGGQDDLSTDAFAPENLSDEEAAEIRRDPIVVVPLAGAAGTGMTLSGHETVRPAFSQVVSMNLLRPDASPPPSSDTPGRVVVIQRQPFLVAAVEFGEILTQPLPGAGDVVAKWSNRDGSRWEIATRVPFNVVLPPQAVGEEMEKARNLAARQNTALDFRLGPNAVVQLARSEYAAVFTEPPWNLRRLLDRPDPVRAGAAVQHLEYELLYGMACGADRPALTRIAEITSRLGRVAGMPPPGPVWRDASPAQVAAYKDWRRRWLRTLGGYLSRLSVLEFWNEHGTGSFVLSDGLSCRLRVGDSGADLAEPFNPDGTPAGPVKPGAVPLQGGATWGFEAAAIYRLVREAPQSTAARATDLMFSALGGWGDVQASYDRGLSTLGAQVAMGRVERYTVERIGRLGCYWNRLKHVIVYERTVAPSAQFGKEQDEFANRAVVRKVEEYVEFVQDRRACADVPGAEPRSAGPLRACSVPEGYRVRVKSAWGANTAHGWKLPLWNLAAEQDQPEIYPRPTIFVTLAGADGGETTTEIANPERLVFFTTTERNTDPDPDQWPPEEGVDYVALPSPVIAETPQTAATPEIAVAAIPPDAWVEPGFEPVTFLLRQAPPVNLMAERAEEAIGAVLRSISPVRATPLAKPEVQEAVKRIREAAGQGRAALEKLEARLAPLLRLSGEDFRRELQQVAPQAVAAAANAYPVATFQAAAAAAGDRAKQVRDRLEGELRRATAEAADRYVYGIGRLRQVQGIPREIGEGYLSQLVLFRDTVGERLRARFPGGTAKPDELRAAVKELIDELRDRLAMTPVNPAPLEHYLKATRELLAPWIVGAGRYVEGLPESLGRAELRALLDTLRRWQADFDALRGQLAAAPAWIPTPTAVLDAVVARNQRWLEPIRLRAETALTTGVSLRKDVVTTAWAGLKPEVDAVLRSIPPELATFPVEDRLIGLERAMAAKADAGVQQVVAEGEAQVRSLISGADALVSKLGENVPIRAAAFRTLAEKYATDAWSTLRPLALTGNELADALRQVPDAARLEGWIRSQRASWEGQIGAGAGMALGEVRRALGEADDMRSRVLRLERAFGDPPQVPGLEFNRPGLAYVFDAAGAAGVNMTPVLAGVNRMVAVGQAAAGLDQALNAVGLHLPTRELAARFVPDALQRFDLNRVFRDLAGLKLDHLFPSLRLPDIANDRVRVRHTFDPGSRRAQVQAQVTNLRIGNPTLLSLGPLRIALEECVFSAETRIEVGADGSTRQDSHGEISANWVLQIGGERMLTLRDAALRFAQGSGLRFAVDPKKVELAPAMKLVTDLLSKWSGKPDGLSVAITPSGIESRFAMALPDLQAGTSAITNLTFGVVLGIRTGGQFGIDAGFQIGRRDAPFALTIFILGGGGYVDVRASFVPAAGTLFCEVEVALTASASLGVSLGPVRGSVAVYVGTTVRYASGGENRGLAVGLLFILAGEVVVLSIVSVSLTLSLRAVWDGQRLNGTGELALKIKICWCFTLKVRREIHFALGCVDSALHPLGAAAGLLSRSDIDDLARLYLASLE